MLTKPIIAILLLAILLGMGTPASAAHPDSPRDLGRAIANGAASLIASQSLVAAAMPGATGDAYRDAVVPQFLSQLQVGRSILNAADQAESRRFFLEGLYEGLRERGVIADRDLAQKFYAAGDDLVLTSQGASQLLCLLEALLTGAHSLPVSLHGELNLVYFTSPTDPKDLHRHLQFLFTEVARSSIRASGGKREQCSIEFRRFIRTSTYGIETAFCHGAYGPMPLAIGYIQQYGWSEGLSRYWRELPAQIKSEWEMQRILAPMVWLYAWHSLQVLPNALWSRWLSWKARRAACKMALSSGNGGTGVRVSALGAANPTPNEDHHEQADEVDSAKQGATAETSLSGQSSFQRR